MVHDLLTNSRIENEDTQRIWAKAVLDTLLSLLQRIAWKKTVRYSIENVELSSRTCVSLCLVLSELVSNALKHGKTEADVSFTIERNQATLCVYDDGDGFAAGCDPRTAAHTGLELVASLVSTELQGKVTYDNHPERGGQVIVTLPLVQSDI